MARRPNAAESDIVHVTLSEQSVDLLKQIAELGRFGRSEADVCARFIDKSLEQFAETPRLKPRIGPRRSRR
jgi:hypothetical protein